MISHVRAGAGHGSDLTQSVPSFEVKVLVKVVHRLVQDVVIHVVLVVTHLAGTRNLKKRKLLALKRILF